MNKKTTLINILTFGLPYKLANQIYNEYESRLSEVNYIITEVSKYKFLQKDKETIEILLALSIFHKRVVSNLDGAVKFYGKVTKISSADVISIGSYDLDNEEKNKLMALLINYRHLLEKYGISEVYFDYYKTKDFILKMINLQSEFENNENESRNRKRNKGDNSEEDIPF
jgi:hypothetical protein